MALTEEAEAGWEGADECNHGGGGGSGAMVAAARLRSEENAGQVTHDFIVTSIVNQKCKISLLRLKSLSAR